MAAATGLACLDEHFPSEGRTALIRAWLSLQNVDDAASEAMAAHFATRPEAFLDFAELPRAALGAAARDQSLTALFVLMRDHPTVRAALAGRLPAWLGRWSRRTRMVAGNVKQDHVQEQRTARIQKQLAALTPEERTRFDRLTTETPDVPAMSLDETAAVLMASRPLAPHAVGLVGWAMAQAVAWDLRNAGNRLGWIVLLNEQDWADTKTAIEALVDMVHASSSSPIRAGTAQVLRLLGDRVSASRAHALSPAPEMRKHRRVEVFCNTNPHDPEADAGSNLERARTAAAEVSPGIVWSTMGSTIHDYNLRDIIPALARFDPKVIVDALRRVVATTPDRVGLALRQLAWRLPDISPILDEPGVEAVRRTLEAVIADPTRLPPDDRTWGTMALVRAITPHLAPEAQLDLLLSLPSDLVLYLDVQRELASLPADVLEARLRAALAVSNSVALTRTLFFAGASRPELTAQSKEYVVEAALSGDHETVACAAMVILAADDPELDRLVLERVSFKEIKTDTNDKEFGIGRAAAEAVIRRDRPDKASSIPGVFLDRVAARCGGAALVLLGDHIEQVLTRLMEPISAQAVSGVEQYLGISVQGSAVLRWMRETTRSIASHDLKVHAAEANDPASSAELFAKRQQALVEEARRYGEALRAENAEAVAAAPPLQGLDRLVTADAVRVHRWLKALLAISDPKIKGQLRNLGLSLACAYAPVDGALAVDVLHHLKGARPSVNVVIGDEQIPLYDHLLFGASAIEALEALRRAHFEDAMDDAALDQATLAAELSGMSAWLAGYINELVASEHPGHQARGLTIASLRQPNADSDRILGMDWGEGFLGAVAATVRETYRRAVWARTWLERAGGSGNTVDFWRRCKLANGVSDLRAVPIFDQAVTKNGPLTPFVAEARHQLKLAAQERIEKRKGTLFGQVRPDSSLVVTLQDRIKR